MSADDCFHLGRQLFDEEEFQYAALWLFEAFNRTKTEQDTNVKTSPGKQLILQYLALSYFEIGTIRCAHISETNIPCLLIYR